MNSFIRSGKDDFECRTAAKRLFLKGTDDKRWQNMNLEFVVNTYTGILSLQTVQQNRPVMPNACCTSQNI